MYMIIFNSLVLYLSLASLLSDDSEIDSSCEDELEHSSFQQRSANWMFDSIFIRILFNYTCLSFVVSSIFYPLASPTRGFRS